VLVTWVKICGITSEEDALLAVAMGADAVGFIFAPSPRQVTASLVHDITRRLPPEILTVGVFRGHSEERIVELVDQAGVRAAQLSGRETPEQAQYVRRRVPFVIKAFPGGHPDVGRAREFGADVVMLDNASPGSGQVFDWRLADGVPPGHKLLLAGGLTAENVVDAIHQVRPWGVDVLTGVEASYGKKDPRKLRAFLAAAKSTTPPAAPAASSSAGPYDWQDDG
jgi:phosphoribosylanthranilate isomerase